MKARKPIARGAALAFVAALTTSCAFSRSADELRRTPFGSFAPAGASLVRESYMPATWTPTGVTCAYLYRVFGTAELASFFEQSKELARQVKAVRTRVMDSPRSNDPNESYAVDAGVFEVAGTIVVLTFYFTDDKARGPSSFVDPRQWRYAAAVRIHDLPAEDGGGCR